MKFRTKIIGITTILLLLALALGNVTGFILVQQHYKDQAYKDSYQRSIEIFSNFQADISKKNIMMSDEQYITHYLKTKADLYTVYLTYSIAGDGMREVYNQTIFQASFFNENTDRLQGKFQSFSFNYGSKNYMVHYHCFDNNVIYHIEDVTEFYLQAKHVVLLIIVVSIAIFVLIEVLMWIWLTKAMRPLQRLSVASEKIAQGNYANRVETKGNDEIAQLGRQFNVMAEAIAKRTTELEAANEQKTLFMGNLTHELRTPLTAITGYSDMLLTTKLSKEDQEEALFYIAQESKRLSRLSDKMMKLLGMEKEDVLVLETVSVQKLFTVIQQACEKNLKAKDIRLVCEEHGEQFMVDVDLVTEAIINIVDNAIRASKQGSEISLRANEKTICVLDHGVGIAPDEVEKITQPFYMVDKSRSRKNGGAGLGLSLTAEIMKAHRGTLVIESTVGQGTCVNLQFV